MEGEHAQLPDRVPADSLTERLAMTRAAAPRAASPRPLIGSRIRERRLSLGRRQAEIAQRAEISAAYLNLIEHNRRPVGPALLHRLAAALEIQADDLVSDREEALIAALRRAAAHPNADPGTVAPPGAELDQISEFAARYPGWAATLAATAQRAEALEQRLIVLSDRMTRDPYLLTTLHEVQSAVTALRSTASILAETPEIEPEWRARFHANIDSDSQRLSRTAQSLVAYLDSFENEAAPMTPQDELEAWVAAGQPAIQQAGELVSDAARTLADEVLRIQESDRSILPDSVLEAVLAEGVEDTDPASLALRLDRPLPVVLRRLGMLRPQPWARAGLIVCNGTGASIYRHPPPGFELPRPGEGCALWPLFEALAQPHLPVARLIETVGGLRFQSWAVAERQLPLGIDGPTLVRAQMLLLPAPENDPRAAWPVGPSCRICPRRGCPARHEPSILAPD